MCHNMYCASTGKKINSLEILGFSIIFGPETKFAISQDVAVQ